MDFTQNVTLTFLSQYQAQKEVAINENFNVIDKLLFNHALKSRNYVDPPNDPVEGDLYLIQKNSTPKGVWIGHQGNVALFVNNEWKFIEIMPGMLFWLMDEERLLLVNNQKNCVAIYSAKN